MKFLKKRSVAVIITAIIIVLAALFGVHRSLGHDAGAVSDMFSLGVRDETQNYTRPSIRSQLEVRATTSLSLITVGNNYSEASDKANTLTETRRYLANLLSDENSGPAELYTANAALQVAFDNLYKALESCELTETHKSDMESCLTRFSGAATVIANSGYNEAVREFSNSTLGVFPTNLLWRMAFVEKPQLFE